MVSSNNTFKKHVKKVKKLPKYLEKRKIDEILERARYYVRDILLKFTEILAEEAEKEFKILNSYRKNHGITELKRLEKAPFVSIWNRFIKRINVPDIGEVGEAKKILLCQDGAKNE